MAKLRFTVSKEHLNSLVANHSDTQARLRREAAQIASKAEANKAGHVHLGYLHIENEGHVVGRGKYGHVDHFISLVDPTGANNDVAVYAIEFGGEKWGEGRRRVHNPGKYILSRAAGLV